MRPTDVTDDALTLFAALLLAVPAGAMQVQPGPNGAFTVAIEQDGKTLPVVNHRATLRRAPFSIVLTMPAASGPAVNASFDPRLFEMARRGMPLAPYFRGDHLMAEGEFNPDKDIIVKDNANHYWGWSKDLVKFDEVKLSGGRYRARRVIANFSVGDKAVPIERSTQAALYLVFVGGTFPNNGGEIAERQREYLTLSLGGAVPAAGAAASPPRPFDGLLASTGRQCEAALTDSMPAWEGYRTGRTLVLRKTDQSDWSFTTEDQIASLKPARIADIELVACVTESTRDSGKKYDDGAAAIDRIWQVRVMTREGQALFDHVFTGSAPYRKNNPGPGVGEPPRTEASKWLAFVLGGKTILTTGGMRTLVFSADGNMLALGGAGSRLRLWDVVKGREVLSARTGGVYDAAFSPDGRTIATGELDKSVNLRDVATAEPQRILTGHIGAVSPVVFSPDGAVLVTGSGDGVRIWNAKTGKQQTTIGTKHAVEAMGFSPDGSVLALSNWADSAASLWDTGRWRKIRTFKGHTADLHSVAFSPDGKTLATAAGDGTVRLWDVTTGAELRTLRFPGTLSVYSVAFSNDGTKIAAALGFSNAVVVWDVASGREVVAFEGYPGGVMAVAFTPNGWLATSTGTIVRFWPPEALSGTRR